jgi:hypothetical protein
MCPSISDRPGQATRKGCSGLPAPFLQSSALIEKEFSAIAATDG